MAAVNEIIRSKDSYTYNRSEVRKVPIRSVNIAVTLISFVYSRPLNNQ